MRQLPIVQSFDYDENFVNRTIHIHGVIFWQGDVRAQQDVMIVVQKNIVMTYDEVYRAVEQHLTSLQQMYFASLPSVMIMANGEFSIQVKQW